MRLERLARRGSRATSSAEPLWHPTFRAGTLSATTPGLVIARRAAEDLHVAVGDRLAVRHPVPTGAGAFGLVSTTLQVSGMHSSPLRFMAHANAAAAADHQVSARSSTGSRTDISATLRVME